MPLILPPETWDAWLDPAATVNDLLPLLAPLASGLLDVVRVGPAVNKAATEGPECLTLAACRGGRADGRIRRTLALRSRVEG